MITSKKGVRHLVQLCYAKGMEHAVLSPGSRNAPIINAFIQHGVIQCHSICDERSAAFYALGIAQQTHKPVALVCTSGSAVLNYAPAIAEAYYQKIPLLVITADRPNEWIDQGENQSILQSDIYRNYIRKSVELPIDIGLEKDQWYSDRLINEAINCCLYPEKGPVHINVPLREPLYEMIDESTCVDEVKVIETIDSRKTSAFSLPQHLMHAWTSAASKIIIVGLQPKDDILTAHLSQLLQDPSVVMLTEQCSNVLIQHPQHIDTIDACIEYISNRNDSRFLPEIVVTVGGAVVSKKLKFYLRSKQIAHWHVSNSNEHWDTFQNLQGVLNTSADKAIEALCALPFNHSSTYGIVWSELRKDILQKHNQFLDALPFCDLKAFEIIWNILPKRSNVQLGNSTPVRYANILPSNIAKEYAINSNRGVSGIDGVLSTAAGAALVLQEMVFCICGDITFLYDSNALWNNKLPSNLKIIVINNGGGNIFKIIPGPSNINQYETFIETRHNVKISSICDAYNVKHFSCNDVTSLELALSELIAHTGSSALLEIHTDSDISSNTLKQYFNYIIK